MLSKTSRTDRKDLNAGDGRVEDACSPTGGVDPDAGDRATAALALATG
jgi:hypothetical protein